MGNGDKILYLILVSEYFMDGNMLIHVWHTVCGGFCHDSRSRVCLYPIRLQAEHCATCP